MTLDDKIAGFLDNAQRANDATNAIVSYFGESDLGAAAQEQLITALLALERNNPTIRFCLDGAGLQLMRTVHDTERLVLLVRLGDASTISFDGVYEGIPYQAESITTDRGRSVLVMTRRRAPADVLTSQPLIDKFRAKMLRQNRPILLILGPARKKVFVDGQPYQPTRSSLNSNTASDTRARAPLYLQMRLVLEGAVQSFIEAGIEPAIAEGGWSGVLEAEFGAPMLAYQVAIAHDLVVFQAMPQDGAYNRNQAPTVHRIAGLAWGDDSPTLIAVGDAAIVFQPAGAWTDVEVDNLRALEKPIAFVQSGNGRSAKSGIARESDYAMSASSSANFDLGKQIGTWLRAQLRLTGRSTPLSRDDRAKLSGKLARL